VLYEKPRIMKITIAILFFTIVACSHQKKEKKEPYAKPPLEVNDEPDEVDEVSNSIRSFLTQFTKAIDKNDTTEVLKHINLPLEVKGHEDHDPRLAIKNKLQIFEVLQTSLNNESYEVKTDKVFKNSIHLKKSLITQNKNNPQSDTTFSVTDFDFKLINGQWKLMRVYLDTRGFQN
jgi:hypothetical protein